MIKGYFKEWLKAAAIRAVKTVAQTALGSIGAAALISEVDWAVVGSASALAGIVSLLMSIAGLPEVDAPELDYADTTRTEPLEDEMR